MYNIVRMYQRDRKPRTIKRGLTLEQAQAHCADPETSSKTATNAKARKHTEYYGPWFDGYEECKRKMQKVTTKSESAYGFLMQLPYARRHKPRPAKA